MNEYNDGWFLLALASKKQFFQSCKFYPKKFTRSIYHSKQKCSLTVVQLIILFNYISTTASSRASVRASHNSCFTTTINVITKEMFFAQGLTFHYHDQLPRL